MARRIRWAVIGSAGIAHRRTIPEGFTKASNAHLVCAYDIDSDANKTIAKQFDIQAATSLEELLDSQIDAVYIATPAHLHCEQVCACASAGKHVLCEKPLGLNVHQAETMVKCCDINNIQFGTALMMRFQSQHRQALQMIQRGDLGKPVYGRAQLSCWYPPMEGVWRQEPTLAGGGSLMDMGGHCIDLLEMFFGPVREVNCVIRHCVHPYPVEDSAVATLSFENGAIGTVDTFFCVPDESSRNRLELYGSSGSILAHGTIGQGEQGTMTAWLDSNDNGYDAQQGKRQCSGTEICPPPVNTYQAEIEEFSAAILESRCPFISAEIGLRNQKVIAACYDSAATGKSVTIPR